jgi:hypothetical protein
MGDSETWRWETRRWVAVCENNLAFHNRKKINFIKKTPRFRGVFFVLEREWSKFVSNYSRAPIQRSASMAAIQPVPAAVTAWR